ncbi:tryptophan synthase subunit alpha [Candidatus Enterococcus murrayae]|uniref:Tryptophan synthase alpha chain n=1 Tax=Candidatus Enterococcus murrayae TaxID=2815321 RepID=A0ABS3HGD2_9ENTE|nr:tryptophan synthase subunit alpha [Enterococcus sp. MJM16]MBO0452510.1 tryptophan synthase subunit alpha [Enterococcus sp. MJM16]
MKPLTQTLKNKAETEKLFVPYIMAGAQGLDKLEEEIAMLAEQGAAAIELGVPFSDPVADGPTIQAAGLRAFAQQVTLKKLIAVLQEIHSDVPLILMGYSNSFFHYGIKELVKDLQETDVQGFIIPDLPYEHRDLVLPDLGDKALLTLVSLTSPAERIEQLTAEAEGFIYAVTVNGITGTDQNFRKDLLEHLAKVKAVSDIPVLAGFGISTSEHVKSFQQVCDGVVIGSKIVRSLEQQGTEKTGELVAEIFR